MPLRSRCLRIAPTTPPDRDHGIVPSIPVCDPFRIESHVNTRFRGCRFAQPTAIVFNLFEISLGVPKNPTIRRINLRDLPGVLRCAFSGRLRQSSGASNDKRVSRYRNPLRQRSNGLADQRMRSQRQQFAVVLVRGRLLECCNFFGR
jgi:hypothetical protein